MKLKFKEPAPITDHSNPLESMMERFDEAAKILGLDESTYNALKSPEKAVIVSLPVTMDNGKIRVFQGCDYWSFSCCTLFKHLVVY